MNGPEPAVVILPAGAVPAGGDRLIWYFGASYRRWRALETAGPAAPVGDLVNAVAARLKPEIDGLDERLATGRFSLSWAASSLGERNPLISNFCLDLCRAVALIEAARAGGRHLVAVEDAGLGRALAQICRDAGIAARWQGPGARPLAGLWRILRAQLSFLRTHVRRRPAGRLAALAGGFPWLLSWVGADGLDPGRDAFFGALPGWLRERGFPPGRLGNPMGWMAPFDAIAAAVEKSEEPAALVTAALPAGTALRCLLGVAAFPWSVRWRLRLAGLDLSPLLRRGILDELSRPTLATALAYAGVAAGLRGRGLAPPLLLYTYENQPWERTLVLGFRRHLPATRLVGVQHAPLAVQYFSACPGRRQWAEGTAPDLLVTIGPEFRERLLAAGAPPERVAVGGAWRFPDLAVLPPRPPRPAAAERMILVACSFDFEDSLELCHKAVRAVADLPGLTLAINFHPFTNREFRRRLEAELAAPVDRCRFSDAPARALLAEADLLLYSSSGVAFEAAALGVPVLYVGPATTLDLDKLGLAADRPCRDARSLRAALPDRLATIEAGSAARARVGHCFAAPDRDWWAALLTAGRGGRNPA